MTRKLIPIVCPKKKVSRRVWRCCSSTTRARTRTGVSTNQNAASSTRLKMTTTNNLNDDPITSTQFPRIYNTIVTDKHTYHDQMIPMSVNNVIHYFDLLRIMHFTTFCAAKVAIESVCCRTGSSLCACAFLIRSSKKVESIKG